MPTKAAIIGLGKVGKTHARHWTAIPNIEVVAALDTHIGTDNQSGVAYTEWSQMLRQAKPDIIDICTPPLCTGTLSNGLLPRAKRYLLRNR